MIQIGKMGDGGRVIIPAVIRKSMKVNSGDNIMFYYKDGELKILNPKETIEKIRAKAQKLKKIGENVTDDFLKSRKEYSGDLWNNFP